MKIENGEKGRVEVEYIQIKFNDLFVGDNVKVTFIRGMWKSRSNTWQGKVISTGYSGGSKKIRYINIEGHGPVFGNEKPQAQIARSYVVRTKPLK